MLKTLCMALLVVTTAASWVSGQISCTLRGKVTDGVSGQPLRDISIQLYPHSAETKEFRPEDALEAIATDSLGTYRLEGLEPGRYTIVAQGTGYAGMARPDVQLGAGKQVVLPLRMSPAGTELESVRIVGEFAGVRGNCDAEIITVDDTRRFAAVLWDPARMMAAHSRVVQTNDQANHFSILGNAPSTNQWRIEGAEVLSPNHLGNAGIASDRPAPTGGGTSMLNTQMMDRSTLFASVYPTRFSNALGGIMDIRLRDGNTEKFEFAAQAGLVGVDLSAEGPTNRQKTGSFLFNYRYSTVGLLGLIGIPLGDEAIDYQDFSLKLVQDGGSLGKFSLWGLWGKSITAFESADSLGAIDEVKDLYNIRYDSQSLMGGLNHDLSLNDRTQWKSRLAVSRSLNDWSLAYPFRFASLDSLYRFSRDESEQRLVSVNSWLDVKVGEKGSSLQMGGVFSHRNYEGFIQDEIGTIEFPGYLQRRNWNFWTAQGFADADLKLGSRLELTAGVHVLYFSNSATTHFNPRLSARWMLTEGQQLGLSFGRNHQVVPMALQRVFDPMTEAFPYFSLRPMRSDQLSLEHEVRWGPQRMETGVFGQLLGDLPMTTDGEAATNIASNYTRLVFDRVTEGRNYGVFTTLDRRLGDGFYGLASGNVFRSETRRPDGSYGPTAWSTNYAVKVSVGWEGERTSRKEKVQHWGVNVRGTHRGGLRYAAIDAAASQALGQTVRDGAGGYTEATPAFTRADLRVYLTRNRPRWTSTLALDIQNFLNLTNVIGYDYDPWLGEVVERTSLGIIPILSYRMQFN